MLSIELVHGVFLNTEGHGKALHKSRVGLDRSTLLDEELLERISKTLLSENVLLVNRSVCMVQQGATFLYSFAYQINDFYDSTFIVSLLKNSKGSVIKGINRFDFHAFIDGGTFFFDNKESYLRVLRVLSNLYDERMG